MDLYPRARLSPTNPGPYIVVTSYILMSVMVLCTILKMLRPGRKRLLQVPRVDEILLLFAMAIAVGENVVIQEAVEHGFGESGLPLTPQNVSESHKMIYIGRLLFTVSMSLARLSILYFIGLLAVTEWVIKINQALIGIVAVWSVAALFAFAFQCQLPYPWDSEPGRCVNQQALNYFDIILGIIIDFLTFALPISIIWNVQIDMNRKGIIATAFATRLLVCLAEIFQIHALKYPDNWQRYSGNGYAAVLWMQVAVNFNIISASVPSLQPLFNNLQSGLMDTTLRSASLSSTVDTWNRRMQSGAQWSLPTSKRPTPRRTARADYWADISLTSRSQN